MLPFVLRVINRCSSLPAMRRIQLSLFLVGLLGAAGTVAYASPSGALLNAILIRSSGSNGATPAGVDLTFDASLQPIITLNQALNVDSLKFGDSYYSYSFQGTNQALLGIDSGGINFSAQTESAVDFDSSLALQLLANQTWTVNGTLDIASDISGPTAAGQSAAVSIQSANTDVLSRVTLSGTNTYTGGTTIGSHIAVIAASNQALGSAGTVTLNGGTLAVASGINLFFNTRHPLVINSGTLAGSGTFNVSSSVDIKGGLNGQIVLSPGMELPGQLNFGLTSAAALIFDSGGTYHWKLRDATNPAGGWDTINVAGAVTVTATSATPFNLTLDAVSADGSPGPAANFNFFSPYSWTILTADSITGFDAAKFNLTAGDFLQSSGGGTFSLRLSDTGTSLMLDFSPIVIPEPATWALLLSGIAFAGFAGMRRRSR